MLLRQFNNGNNARRSRHRSIRKWWGSLIVTMGVLCACGQPQDLSIAPGSPLPTNEQHASTTRRQPTPQPEYPDTGYWQGEQELEQRLLNDLADPRLRPDVRRSLEEKLDMLRRKVAQQATAMAQPPAPKPNPDLARPTMLPEHLLPQPSLGIIESTEDVQEWGIIVRNRWQEWYSKEERHVLMAFAGAEQHDPSQGLILVSTLGSSKPAGGYYPTPRKAGAVRIIAEHNRQLTLAAEDGSLLVFDLNMRTYLNLPPTATPTR